MYLTDCLTLAIIVCLVRDSTCSFDSCDCATVWRHTISQSIVDPVDASDGLLKLVWPPSTPFQSSAPYLSLPRSNFNPARSEPGSERRRAERRTPRLQGLETLHQAGKGAKASIVKHVTRKGLAVCSPGSGRRHHSLVRTLL